MCGGPAATRHRFLSPPGVAERFEIRQCRDCAHAFTWPRPSEALLRSCYESPAHIGFQTSPEHLAGRAAVDDARWVEIGRLAPEGTVVDIGSGSGPFLSRAPQGYRVTGVETAAPLVDFCRERFGIAVFPSLDAAVAGLGAPDAITLWDALEHLADPRAALAECFQALAPGGILVVGVPNAVSAEARFFGAHWFGWTVPVHLHHFRAEVLEGLLAGVGFRVLETRYEHYGFMFESSWAKAMGENMANVGAFAALHSGPWGALRLIGDVWPAATRRLRTLAQRRLARRVLGNAHARERCHLTIAAHKD